MPAVIVTMAVRASSLLFLDKAVILILSPFCSAESHVLPLPSMTYANDGLFVLTVTSAVAPSSLVSSTCIGETDKVAGSSGNL